MKSLDGEKLTEVTVSWLASPVSTTSDGESLSELLLLLCPEPHEPHEDGAAVEVGAPKNHDELLPAARPLPLPKLANPPEPELENPPEPEPNPEPPPLPKLEVPKPEELLSKGLLPKPESPAAAAAPAPKLPNPPVLPVGASQEEVPPHCPQPDADEDADVASVAWLHEDCGATNSKLAIGIMLGIRLVLARLIDQGKFGRGVRSNEGCTQGQGIEWSIVARV
jgi:hypothetical protein